MTSVKYSFLIIFLITLLISFAAPQAAMAKSYSAKECLDQDFKTHTKGKGSLFGLLKHDLKITKSDCVIEAYEKKYFYLETNWIVDICREPIHLKKEQFKSTSVFKKSRKCSNDPGSEFCQETNNLMNLFKDIGLIFAEGNRQSLESDHGKTYCAYLLIKEYLKNDSIFVSGQDEVYIEGLRSEVKTFVPVNKVVEPSPSTYIDNTNQAIETEQVIESVSDEVEASGSF